MVVVRGKEGMIWDITNLKRNLRTGFGSNWSTLGLYSWSKRQVIITPFI